MATALVIMGQGKLSSKTDVYVEVIRSYLEEAVVRERVVVQAEGIYYM